MQPADHWRYDPLSPRRLQKLARALSGGDETLCRDASDVGNRDAPRLSECPFTEPSMSVQSSMSLVLKLAQAANVNTAR
jgi:hypothetical protein